MLKIHAQETDVLTQRVVQIARNVSLDGLYRFGQDNLFLVLFDDLLFGLLSFSNVAIADPPSQLSLVTSINRPADMFDPVFTSFAGNDPIFYRYRGCFCIMNNGLVLFVELSVVRVDDAVQQIGIPK